LAFAETEISSSVTAVTELEISVSANAKK